LGRVGNPKLWFLSIGGRTSVMVGHLQWIGYLGKNCPNIQDEPGSDIHPTLEIITFGGVNHLVNGIALEISNEGIML
jgi:hypothetical protein